MDNNSIYILILNRLWGWIQHNRTIALATVISAIVGIIQVGFDVVDHLSSSSDIYISKEQEDNRQAKASQRQVEPYQMPLHEQPNPQNSTRSELPKPVSSTMPNVNSNMEAVAVLSKHEPNEVTRLLERLGDTSGQNRCKRLLNYLPETSIGPLTSEQILQILGNISGDSVCRSDALHLIMQNNKNESLSGQDAIRLLEGFVDNIRATTLLDMLCQNHIKRPIGEAEKQSLLAGVGLSWRSYVERALDAPINSSCQ